MDKKLHDALEDAIWQALDSEQGMPHSGVDPDYVIPEFLRLLADAGYTITPISGLRLETRLGQDQRWVTPWQPIPRQRKAR